MSKQMFRDFVVTSRRAENIPARTADVEPRNTVPSASSADKKKGFGAKGLSLFFFFVVLLVFGFMKLTSLFSTAVVTVTPVGEDIVLDDVIVASKTLDENSAGLIFKNMQIEEKESLPIIAEKSETVSRKASGKIIVYNNYSDNVQKLIAGTRFESPEGYIYKINSAISVPGKKVSGGKSIPGSLEVIVYASEPGIEYNIGPSDFTIPGLKGGPRYKDVYARGVGNISGGYVGEVKIISEDDISLARKKLEASLKQKLLSKAKKQLPSGFVMYDDMIFLNYTDNASDLETRSEGNRVMLTMGGKLSALIFDGKDLAETLARNKVPGIDNYNVHSGGLENLEVKMIGRSGFDVAKDNSFSFRMKGETRIVWDFDTDSFRDNLAGMNKSDYEKIFRDFPMVEKAETVFSPSWSSKFPDTVDNISIEIIEN